MNNKVAQYLGVELTGKQNTKLEYASNHPACKIKNITKGIDFRSSSSKIIFEDRKKEYENSLKEEGNKTKVELKLQMKQRMKNNSRNRKILFGLTVLLT